MSAGNLNVAPAPGMIPRRVSGRPIMALEVRTRMCVARPSSRPPPRAIEDMAEIEGMGSAERAANVLWIVETNARTLER